MSTARSDLAAIFQAGIKAVSGRQAVSHELEREPITQPDTIIAVGKAASGMCLGALDVFGPNINALVATKYHHVDPELSDVDGITIFESAHPVPDQNSLNAGQALLNTISQIKPNESLLLLISGGASAIAESLPDDVSLEYWQQLNQQMLASGQNIAQINTARKKLSQIKDGRLLADFKGKQVTILAISDVQGDDIATIGSGIGDIKSCKAKAEVRLVATNKVARDASKNKAIELGYTVNHNLETLYDDVFILSTKIAKFLLNAGKGIYIWGGEPTLALPSNPGNGGRNQSLALALAKEISGSNEITILVAGTDGTDGPSDAAGAIIDGNTFADAIYAQAALDTASAGDYLSQTQDIFITGPTGTNVMDLVIALKT